MLNAGGDLVSERVSFAVIEDWEDGGTIARITGSAAGESTFVVRCSGVERTYEIVVRSHSQAVVEEHVRSADFTGCTGGAELRRHFFGRVRSFWFVKPYPPTLSYKRPQSVRPGTPGRFSKRNIRFPRGNSRGIVRLLWTSG